VFPHEKAVPHLLTALEAVLNITPPGVDSKASKKKKDGTPTDAESDAIVHGAIPGLILLAVQLSAWVKPALLEEVVFKSSKDDAWGSLLALGLFHRSPHVRKNMNVSLANLCIAFPAAYRFMLPKALAVIGQLDTSHSQVCADYFEFIGSMLRKSVAVAGGAADGKEKEAGKPAASGPAKDDSKAGGGKAEETLYDAKALAHNLCNKIKNHPVLVRTRSVARSLGPRHCPSLRGMHASAAVLARWATPSCMFEC
jgi:hypothetical protein